ncbi:MAG: hypothetical protein WBC74_01080 [Candidatus Omnitrophota bacterium]
MEKAIHITKPDNFKYYRPRYGRIYFGAEFCQNLIPSVKEVKFALDFAKKRNLHFTLMAPFVTENGLLRLEGIFKFLKAHLSNCEVVVNDWGVLEVLSERYKSFTPLLGRLLARQNRDPAMARVLEKQPPYGVRAKDGKIRIIAHIPPGARYQKGIKASYVNAPSVQRLLSRFKVERLELNNLVQGINLEGIKFKVSLYTPFVNICTTRFCPMASRIQKIYRINACRRECQRYTSRLRNKAIPNVLYKRGNTTFYKNPLNPKAIDEPAVDRIVFQPELPF